MDQTILHCRNRQRGSAYCQTGKRTPETQCTARRGEPHPKKSDCHIHATLKQRLDAVHKLRFQHSIKTLCRILRVNRSTYYKHFRSKPAPRTEENQHIATAILRIFSDYNKRLGTYKICYLLQRDYGIDISVGRVYRLMKKLQLPKMSTDKPKYQSAHPENGPCCNHLQQNFNPKAPQSGLGQ